MTTPVKACPACRGKGKIKVNRKGIAHGPQRRCPMCEGAKVVPKHIELAPHDPASE